MISKFISIGLISLLCSALIISNQNFPNTDKISDPSKATALRKQRPIETDSDDRGTRSSYEDNYFQFDENGDPVYPPVYGGDKLLQYARPGDIFFDSVGSFYGLGYTGHVGIIEAIIGTGSNRYIRTIEAVPNFGVARAVLDSNRFASNKMVFRVGTATASQKNAAISFCVGQLGKSYSLHNPPHSSSNSESWYCSELIWAAYINQGVTVANTSNPFAIMPTDIADHEACHLILDYSCSTTVTQGETQHTYHCNGSDYSENHFLDIQVATNIFVCSICNKMIFPG